MPKVESGRVASRIYSSRRGTRPHATSKQTLPESAIFWFKSGPSSKIPSFFRTTPATYITTTVKSTFFTLHHRSNPVINITRVVGCCCIFFFGRRRRRVKYFHTKKRLLEIVLTLGTKDEHSHTLKDNKPTPHFFFVRAWSCSSPP